MWYLRAQSEPVPKFAVVAIHPCKGSNALQMRRGNSSPGRLSTGCDFLVDDNNLGLIQSAYVRYADGHFNPLGVIPIKGGPAWIRSQMYSIEAVADGHPSLAMMQGPMLKAILEDRFQLKIRHEIQQGPVYELAVAKGGPKLKPFVAGSCAPFTTAFPIPPPPAGQRYCKDLVSVLKPSVDAEGMSISHFSQLLNLVLDRPVIDKTGIAGLYDIHLEFSRDSTMRPLPVAPPSNAPPAASEPNGPTIFTAIQEQLGLKLVPATGPVEFFVIDHVERPSEN